MLLSGQENINIIEGIEICSDIYGIGHCPEKIELDVVRKPYIIYFWYKV